MAKFYCLDAATPNTGTMPGAGNAFIQSGDSTGREATARNARDATDVAGTSNPDIESSITATANVVSQSWGHRRFVSRPLAAHTFATADGNWTFSYARSESNTSHNGRIFCWVSGWSPTSGAQIGSGRLLLSGTAMSATAETADSVTAAWSATSLTIADGDILVFEVFSSFTQGMSTAYTDQFAYNGTTEASTTTCASFITPPAALTLFTATTTLPNAMTARTRY